MLNSDFLGHQAQALARRIQQDAPDDLPAQLEQLFQYTLGRTIAADEKESCTSAFKNHLMLFKNGGAEDAQAYQQALASVCQVVFSTSEFIYIQ